jgi:hypothetical protein
MHIRMFEGVHETIGAVGPENQDMKFSGAHLAAIPR